MGNKEVPAAAGSTAVLVEGEPVWRLLLQAVVCKLLCCSRAMTAVVHSSCQHRLAVQLRQHSQQPHHLEQLVNQLSTWLQKHQDLVCRQLLIPAAAVLVGPAQQPYSQAHSVPDAVAALQQQLKRLAKISAAAVPALPSPLNPPALTRLEWAVSSDSKPRTFLTTLMQLTCLRSLALTFMDSTPGAISAHTGAFGDLAPAVHTLTALTALHLQHFSISRTASPQLPASLSVLTLGQPLPRLRARTTREQQLLLQHLTALQELDLHSLRGCDVLPVGLRSLRVHHCSVLPLLPLQRLQELHITGVAPESVLGQLSRMQSLEQLHLTYSSWSLSAAGVKHLQQLPLHGLRCVLSMEQLAVLGQIGASGNLAHLQVQLQQGQSQDEWARSVQQGVWMQQLAGGACTAAAAADLAGDPSDRAAAAAASASARADTAPRVPWPTCCSSRWGRCRESSSYTRRNSSSKCIWYISSRPRLRCHLQPPAPEGATASGAAAAAWRDSAACSSNTAHMRLNTCCRACCGSACSPSCPSCGWCSCGGCCGEQQGGRARSGLLICDLCCTPRVNAVPLLCGCCGAPGTSYQTKATTARAFGHWALLVAALLVCCVACVVVGVVLLCSDEPV